MTVAQSKNDHVSGSRAFAGAPEGKQLVHKRAVEYADQHQVSYAEALAAVTAPNQDSPAMTALKAHRRAPQDRQKLNAQLLDYAEDNGIGYVEAVRAFLAQRA